LTYDKSLSEQGVDSLDLSGLLFSLEETFKIEIPDDDIDELQTINEIVVYVNSKCE
jgi:acyl carrier protein